MAKKKHSTKKHRFKYAEPTTVVTADSSSSVAASPAQAPLAAARPHAAGVSVPSGRSFTYVGRDLRRIAVLGGGLVVVELALWYLFGHTSLGPTVYNWIKF